MWIFLDTGYHWYLGLIYSNFGADKIFKICKQLVTNLNIITSKKFEWTKQTISIVSNIKKKFMPSRKKYTSICALTERTLSNKPCTLGNRICFVSVLSFFGSFCGQWRFHCSACTEWWGALCQAPRHQQLSQVDIVRPVRVVQHHFNTCILRELSLLNSLPPYVNNWKCIAKISI